LLCPNGEPVTLGVERLAERNSTVDRNDPILNRRITEISPLTPPRVVRRNLPLSSAGEELVEASRNAVANVLDGRDDRLLVIVGPCSVHDPKAALEYAARLRRAADDLDDRLLVLMRVYFEKPRTSVGWKGLINDPRLDGSHRLDEGLTTARRLLVSILSLGLPIGCEFLDPITPQYIADAVSWGAIGARTSQSQIHRQLASGLSMPIGFKNSTDGSVQSAIDGVFAATHPQVFPGITDDGVAAVVATSGNPDCHVVLRGGERGPNYSSDHVADVRDRLRSAGLPQGLVIDASHGNSQKDYRRQSSVAREVAVRIVEGEQGLNGLMLESFLLEGRQDLASADASQLRYGQSVTDACIGWDETADVLVALAEAVRRRRESRRPDAPLSAGRGSGPPRA
jgi:3-deoxy-7-phosphoheptulonate synthase